MVPSIGFTLVSVVHFISFGSCLLVSLACYGRSWVSHVWFCSFCWQVRSVGSVRWFRMSLVRGETNSASCCVYSWTNSSSHTHTLDQIGMNHIDKWFSTRERIPMEHDKKCLNQKFQPKSFGFHQKMHGVSLIVVVVAHAQKAPWRCSTFQRNKTARRRHSVWA